MSYKEKDVLEQLYLDEGLDQEEIANRFGVTQGAISKWIRRYNIKRPLEDGERLREMYEDKDMSLSEIADEIGCWKGSVGKAMERHGIDRDVSNREKLPFPKTNKDGYVSWRQVHDGKYKAIYVHRLLAASEYGPERLKGNDVHHINGIEWDNRPENIEVLSREAHNKRHPIDRDEQGRFTNRPVCDEE